MLHWSTILLLFSNPLCLSYKVFGYWFLLWYNQGNKEQVKGFYQRTRLYIIWDIRNFSCRKSLVFPFLLQVEFLSDLHHLRKLSFFKQELKQQVLCILLQVQLDQEYLFDPLNYQSIILRIHWYQSKFIQFLFLFLPL